MSKSIVLECRQKDSSLINQNGDYETNFKSGVVEINTGDVITLKSAYIDTTFQNQYNFLHDVILNIEFGYYISDWDIGQGKTDYVNDDLTGPDFCTGAIYSPYKYIEAGELDPNIFEYITGIVYFIAPLTGGNDEISFYFNYLDVNGQSRTLIKTYPKGYFVNGTYKPLQKEDSTTPILVKKGSFKPTTITVQEYFLDAGLDADSGFFFLDTGIPTTDIYEPYILTTNILIEAGSYTPENLAQVLTEKMASNRSTKNAGVFNNKFISPVNVFDVGKPDPQNPNNQIQETVFWYNQTGYQLSDPIPEGEDTGSALTNGFTFAPNSNTLAGASQITWQYDEISQKMQLLYIHTPMYDSTTGADLSVYYLRQGSNYEEQQRRGSIYTCARHSGIYFTGLSATDSVSKKSIPFWENLGFNLSKLCAVLTPLAQQEVDIFDKDDGFWYYYNLKNGLNITDGYVGIDSIIKKSVNEWYEVVNIPDDSNTGFVSTIQASTIINPDLSIPQIFTPYSHFLISCDLNYTSDYYAGDSSWTKISAIVSRYYAYGSYTSGDGAQSIQYEHMGAPIYLKNARIRILTPDKIVEPELGADNTIMMEIIKPLAPPQQNIKK